MLKTGDKVIVIAGKHKGMQSTIKQIFRKENKVIVENVNVVTKHNKPSQANPDGGITTFEAPIHISNVALASKSKLKAKKTKSANKDKGKNNKVIDVKAKPAKETSKKTTKKGKGK